MGELIPIMCDEVVPGDIFKISNRVLVRCEPFAGVPMHPLNVYVHYFFDSYRHLCEETGVSWEDFLTGGVDGAQTDTLDTWNVSDTSVGSLWDYFGFPTGVTPDADSRPLSFPKQAYNDIFNEWYRDETLVTEVSLDAENVLFRPWPKDYFGGALITRQRGTAPALALSGTTNAEWPALSGANQFTLYGNSSTHVPYETHTKQTLENNTVDFSNATTFDIADIRTTAMIQQWMERNGRAGFRLTEFIRSHYNVAPSDSRLQRPEFIGATRFPIIVSEVLQTESSDASTPQGTLAGHGIAVDSQYVGKYRVKEHGLIMGIMSIMPTPLYQQGIDRQWLRSTKYDFYFPEFANLSDQAILRREIYLSGVKSENETVFGYIGRYDEMRHKRNMVCGLMRTTYDHWHASRQFSSAPSLNSAFIQTNGSDPSPRKDIFAVPASPGFIVDFGNIIHAVRPMPAFAQPGVGKI